ncbi:hypothetical protein F8M41_014603 [Gigaspora margarita]|uniref:Uncharacterized protein n=1 Tax=Gigaspora margarita TaxID=4874 RepID=A0A8H4B3E4_GIGMA|nr:hypothetical protein F8M41_014603 [Gigaspora margarita]
MIIILIFDNKLQCDWEQWMQEKTTTKSFGAYNKDNDSKNNDDKDNENVCIKDDDEGQTSFCHQYLSRKITASQIDKELVDATNLLIHQLESFWNRADLHIYMMIFVAGYINDIANYGVVVGEGARPGAPKERILMIILSEVDRYFIPNLLKYMKQLLNGQNVCQSQEKANDTISNYYCTKFLDKVNAYDASVTRAIGLEIKSEILKAKVLSKEAAGVDYVEGVFVYGFCRRCIYGWSLLSVTYFQKATPHNIKGSFSIGRSILYKATTKYMNSGYEVNTELVALAVDDIENRIEPETTTWKKFDRVAFMDTQLKSKQEFLLSCQLSLRKKIYELATQPWNIKALELFKGS